MRSLAALALLLTLACSHGQFDPFQRGTAYDDASKRFIRALRWNQIAMASEMVDPEERERFVAEASAFAGLRFTDYEILAENVDDDLKHATVDIELIAYDLATLVTRSITVHQKWHRDAETGRWWVRPEVRDAVPANAGTP